MYNLYGAMYRRRNSLRLKGFDYRQSGIYFITVCVNQRLCLFGDVNSGMLRLNPAGKMIVKVFSGLQNYYHGVFSDTYIVMPDHFHGIIIIKNDVGAVRCGRPDQSRNLRIFSGRLIVKNPQNRNGINDKLIKESQQKRSEISADSKTQLSLGEIVGRFKSYTTTQYISGVKNKKWRPFYEKLWQRGYHDHIIRNKKELYAIRKYISNNPLNWKS
jgi:REP element-mobilizing transposase RayT